MDKVLKFAASLALICAMGAIVASGGCSVDTQSATHALNAMGIRDVKFGSYAWFACNRRAPFSSTFTGTGADGKPVSGAVCQGILKSTTVRLTHA
ncbi:hypothetical protein [Mesorhizobium sp.]|uniref:hypothetical protein n=1 Tax=Mesorhizobium sp. TaxID=1871066 RepID=UPI0025D5DF77|nr:hypothetical protein [Mesorhizobium sp.]